MKQQDFDKVLQWLTYPALFKNAVRKAVESGFAFQVLTDHTVSDEMKQQLKTLIHEVLPQADLQKLMKVYEQTFPKIQHQNFNNQIYRLKSEILRITPSHRV